MRTLAQSLFAPALGPALMTVHVLLAAASSLAATERTVRSADAELHVRHASAGVANSEVVLVLHGGPGVSGGHLRVVEDPLTDAGLSVVLHDQRAIGCSVSPTTPSAFTLSDYLHDVDAVRRSTGKERVHLLGHSWGGLLAMLYASHHPEHVLSVTLVNSAPPTQLGLRRGFAGVASRQRELVEAGLLPDLQLPRGDDCTDWIRAWIPVLNFDPRRSLSTDLDGTTCSQRVRSMTWSQLGRYDFTDDVQSVVGPVLVLFGADDPYGLEMLTAPVRTLTSADLTVRGIDRCGHRPMHECPDEFFSELVAFYDRIGATSPGS